MKALKFVSLGIALLFIQACSHPIEIEGQGDVLSASGERNCYLEQFTAGDAVCSKNGVLGFEKDQLPTLIPEDYVETYYPIPRPGWKFDHWETYCTDATLPYFECTFDVPAAAVLEFWGETMPPLKAVFTPIGPDADGDGVPDDIDICPNTPPFVWTLSNGCPINTGDRDNDGTVDYLDWVVNGFPNDGGSPYGSEPGFQFQDFLNCFRNQPGFDPNSVFGAPPFILGPLPAVSYCPIQPH